MLKRKELLQSEQLVRHRGVFDSDGGIRVKLKEDLKA